ncbi:hypothetical protein FRB95_013413 [Tulasnella sp. JGI-2019a]|nr:hypothetical protein FRB95_013413 [Tulasnella sp. JGI-2019a]
MIDQSRSRSTGGGSRAEKGERGLVRKKRGIERGNKIQALGSSTTHNSTEKLTPLLIHPFLSLSTCHPTHSPFPSSLTRQRPPFIPAMNVASLLSGDAPRRPPTSTSNTHPQQQQQQEQSQPPPHHHPHAPSQPDRQSSYHHPPPPPLHPGPGRDGPYHNGLPPLQPSPFENQQQQQQQAPPAGYHPYSQRRPSLSYDPRQQQQAPPPPPTAGQYQNSQNPPNQGGYATPPTMREYAMGNGGGQASQFGHPHLPPAMSNGNNGSNTKLPAMVGPGRHLPPPHAQTQPTNFIPHPASPHAQGHPGYNPNGAPPPPPHQATAHLQSQSQSQSQPQSQPQLPPLPAPYPSHGRGPLMQVVTPQHRLPPNAKSPSRPTNGAATTPNGNGNNSNSSEPGRHRGVGHQHRRSIETKVAASSGAAPFSPLNPGGGDRHAPTLVLPSPNARTTKRTMDDREKEDQMARERSNRPTDNAGGNPTMPALPMPVTYAGNGNGNSKGPDSRSRPTSAFGHRTKGSNGSNGTAPPTGSTGPFGPPPPSNGDDARRPGTAGGSAHHSQHRLSTIPPPLSPSMSAPAPAPPTAPVAPPAPSYGPPPSQQSQPHYANGPQPQQPSHSPNNGYGQQQLQPGPPPSSQHRHHHHHHVVHAHPQQQGPPPPPPQQHHHHQTKYEMDNRMYGADLRDPRQQQAPVGYPPQPMVNGPPPPHLTQPHHHPGNGYGPPPPQHPQMMDPYQHQQQPPPPHHHHVQQHQQQPPPPHYTHAPPPPPPQHQQHYAPPPPPHHVQHLQPQHHHTAPPPPPPPHHQPPPLESTLVEPPHHHHHVHHVHHVHHRQHQEQLLQQQQKQLAQTSAQLLASFASQLTPKAIEGLPNLGTFVYPNLPFPLRGGGEVLLEPKVNVILGGTTGKINEWMEKSKVGGGVAGEGGSGALGLVVEKGKDPSTAIDVDGLDESASASAATVKQERESEVGGEEAVGVSTPVDPGKDGMMSRFFVITVLMAASHLLDAESVPGRTDGTFKLWGSQSVSLRFFRSIYYTHLS